MLHRRAFTILAVALPATGAIDIPAHTSIRHMAEVDSHWIVVLVGIDLNVPLLLAPAAVAVLADEGAAPCCRREPFVHLALALHGSRLRRYRLPGAGTFLDSPPVSAGRDTPPSPA